MGLGVCGLRSLGLRFRGLWVQGLKPEGFGRSILAFGFKVAPSAQTWSPKVAQDSLSSLLWGSHGFSAWCSIWLEACPYINILNIHRVRL